MDTQMSQELAGPARILGCHQGCGPEGLHSPGGKIRKVSDRRGDDEKTARKRHGAILSISLRRCKSIGYTKGMSWKRMVLLVAFLGMACSKDPGELNVTVDGSAVPNLSTTVTSYILIVKDAANTSVLYPNACVDSTQTPNCLVTDATCGFKNDATFRAKIDFSQFAVGDSLTVVMCAMQAGQTVFASGTQTIANTAGQSAAITLSTTNNAANCVDLLSLCS